MSQQNSAASALAAVVDRLNVTQQGPYRFSAKPGPRDRPRLFGGLVAGQATVAASRTVVDLQIHSLHAYFLQPGDPALPVAYEVTPLKEGKNFHARQVLGRQADRIIFSLQASFLRPEAGFSHHEPMPDAPPPEQVEQHPFGFWGPNSPVQVRDCDRAKPGHAQATVEQRRLWLRPAASLPDDPVLHLGMLVFASDMSLLSTGLLHHPELRERPRAGGSLDHALWFHRPTRFDDWLLYALRSPAAEGGRPLITGAMYRRDGTRVMSVAQEGLIRFRT
jgi:acyl-CoA thioesterase-2